MEKKPKYQAQLLAIQEDVIAMGGTVNRAIERAIDALKDRKLSLAHQVIAEDAAINKRRFDIEDKCMELLSNLSEKPSPVDLRTIVAFLNIITELERIGDYAEGIAKIVVMIGDEPPLKPLIDIPRMADITIDMVNRALQALAGHNVELARQVAGLDTVVDSLYEQVFRELLTFMMVDPKTINRATRLIWVAHNLERAADRATNICERVIFTVTGKMQEIGPSEY